MLPSTYQKREKRQRERTIKNFKTMMKMGITLTDAVNTAAEELTDEQYKFIYGKDRKPAVS